MTSWRDLNTPKKQTLLSFGEEYTEKIIDSTIEAYNKELIKFVDKMLDLCNKKEFNEIPEALQEFRDGLE